MKDSDKTNPALLIDPEQYYEVDTATAGSIVLLSPIEYEETEDFKIP